jgi:hypothetical protein
MFCVGNSFLIYKFIRRFGDLISWFEWIWVASLAFLALKSSNRECYLATRQVYFTYVSKSFETRDLSFLVDR